MTPSTCTVFPPNLFHLTCLPRGTPQRGERWGSVRERHKKLSGVLVGAVWVKDQNRSGTRKMFGLGRGACQKHQALVFDEDLSVQDLRVT